jgi:uncharacterized protein YprB with RNaseH-like and TPR domain
LSTASAVTTVALYDGHSIRTYVRGRNLREFVHDVQTYRLLITYNGKSFDMPVLRRCLGCRLDQAHIGPTVTQFGAVKARKTRN